MKTKQNNNKQFYDYVDNKIKIINKNLFYAKSVAFNYLKKLK